jgi:ectoine hydroxylase-related dioxygenase (phytanoyl-CoA dioxygenase family)
MSAEGLNNIGGMLQRDGFVVIPAVLSEVEVQALYDAVSTVSLSSDGVMRSMERYAIRRVMQQVPGINQRIWNARLTAIVRELLGPDAFITKSIWFEKPQGGNWFVGWHQDISISVSHRAEVPGYSRWTAKHGMTAVVPPVAVLERTLTVRIHLDDADGSNGAVRVLPGSHRSGILSAQVDDEQAVTCAVPRGGVMLMRPLLFHASSRSLTDRPRRVLHIELNDLELDGGLSWAERMAMPEGPGDRVGQGF